MPLHCTLVRSPGAALREPPVELTIEGPHGAAGAEVQAALTANFGTGIVSVDSQNVAELRLGQPPLVNGATLVDGADLTARRSRQRTSEPPALLALAVHSGAGAGTVVPLRRGTYTIGRSNADILIPDADVSRAHAHLVVTETAISIVDLDSANGTDVDGERVRNAVISTGSTIRCGNSTMSLVFLERSGDGLADAGMDVHEPLVISRRDDPTNRAALLLTAVLPVVIGVGLAVVTGMWMFLAFTAVSAISILVPVIGGRRQRRELAAAVRAAVTQDQERRRRAAPPLSDLTIGDTTGRDRAGPRTNKGIWLRLGQAIQPANLRFEPTDPGRAIPSAGTLPLTLSPARPLTTIRGPRAAVDGLVRSLLMQLSGYPLGRNTRVVVHGKAEHLPLAARYLDGVTLSSNSNTLGTLLEHGFGPAHGHGLLLLMDGTEPSAKITATALEHGWQVIHAPEDGSALTNADVELGERLSVFNDGDNSIRFAPDLAPIDVFNRFCRRLAREANQPVGAGRSIPTSCRLAELLPHSTPETSRRWSANNSLPGLAVPIGRGLEGLRTLDLQNDGPHLLVAGTTGSGKSELLRSLTVALALSYAPDRINFLFVDFKGGSGLGPLTGLPHCVGMLTDLSSHELERALQSLRAEIKFREQSLAAVQAPDLTSFRATSAGRASPLPHLVIVIDEFRMLVEDAPESLRELMRIAAIGRSLGIHLIMATQRPQGALTADIRANVTTSIALRVQSEMESVDIINSKAAAGIRVDTPGRAYLARGTEAPLEFQAGSLTAGAIRSEPAGISVWLASEYIDAPAVLGGSGSARHEPTPAEATAPLIASMSALWETMNRPAIRKPIAAPLPCLLPEPAGSSTPGTVESDADDDDGASDRTKADAGATRWSVTLGLMDLPAEQRTAPLIWEPAGHGHLALVGGQESGVPEAIRLAVLGLASHARESHLYVLDPDSSFVVLASHCRVGATAGLHELRRAVRILERLAREQSLRLGRPADDDIPLVLVIAGWGSWLSALRAGPLAWAEDVLHDLVRDGNRAGITVIISGQRELVTSRFFAAVPNRVYFPTGSSDDSRIAWPKLPPTAPAVGRGVAVGALSGGRTTVCQFHTAAGAEAADPGVAQAPEPSLRRRPFRVETLPAVVPAARILNRAAPQIPAELKGRIPLGQRVLRIGVGGDELEPISVRAPAGGVLAVLGGPSSGKSSFLRLLPRLNPEAGPWLMPEQDTEPGAYWSGILRQATSGGLERNPVALVDDADLLPQDVNRDLADLNTLGITVVMTAGYSPILPQRVPLALQARNLRCGILIAPRTFMDGDLLGVRFETEPNPPPGRSVLIQNGRATAVQLGWVPPDQSKDGLAA
ncbi:FtsK/SpoIIIE domain-containing protein [Pseudarthrobacter raffinosi]|uniref:FtsK/SpoIIIE domain-containing protein n=1 Tax=Pseudarthrobacter raffinosi TaxID=2953651 RepID=UPI00208E1CB6|nr:FtsK/SpoIIIE domain-containing protein [Pseudarthrobacter sp. MDT3-9]MCO4250989.1 FtsK/SpoIIIE domain-containing protein [Pseudarthrobacter sp. MDT3-9]